MILFNITLRFYIPIGNFLKNKSPEKTFPQYIVNVPRKNRYVSKTLFFNYITHSNFEGNPRYRKL